MIARDGRFLCPTCIALRVAGPPSRNNNNKTGLVRACEYLHRKLRGFAVRTDPTPATASRRLDMANALRKLSSKVPVFSAEVFDRAYRAGQYPDFVQSLQFLRWRSGCLAERPVLAAVPIVDRAVLFHVLQHSFEMSKLFRSCRPSLLFARLLPLACRFQLRVRALYVLVGAEKVRAATF